MHQGVAKIISRDIKFNNIIPKNVLEKIRKLPDLAFIRINDKEHIDYSSSTSLAQMLHSQFKL